MRRNIGQKTQHPSIKDRAKILQTVRKKLPIWQHRTEIVDRLRANDVLLLVGETGSGKSTQVPQFLVPEKWRTACIAVTEPRRVAAISLARRVAAESGSPLGSASPSSTVGYSVRFDNSISPNTKIKFLTEGTLLNELLRDPWLKAYSAVVVDEVHERGVNVDLILGFLQQMIARKYEGRGGIPLKIVVMSATADMERLEVFFKEAYANDDTSLDYKLERNTSGSGSDSEWSGISSSCDKDEVRHTIYAETRPQKRLKLERSQASPSAVASLDSNIRVSTCHVQGRQYPVTVKYTPKPIQSIVDTALHIIFEINFKEPLPGDILVFLTGQETVETLESLIKQNGQGLRANVPKFLVLPLFAALPAEAQQRIFEPAPTKTRKVIIATNIAETSITVPGVRFVVDCGKAKMKQFRPSIGLDSLLVKSISKSAAIQRKGRAGREASGQCFRLYTEADYRDLQEANTPEILRCDLALPILTLKARGVNSMFEFPFLNEPPRRAITNALQHLYRLGALTDTGEISDTGQEMVKLPLPASLARVLTAATEPDVDCAAEVIDIISCLSVENMFLNLTSEEKKEEAEVARRGLYNRDGDHLTLLKTVQAYTAESSDRKAWADRHFVSHRAMKAVMQVRKQIREQSKAFLRKGEEETTILTVELGVTILKCFLKGFGTNTARLFPDGSYKTIDGHEVVSIHPSSCLFGKKVEAIMYNEYVFTNRSYAKGVSAVQVEWIGEALGV